MVIVESFKLSDFVIECENNYINLLYSFYPKQSEIERKLSEKAGRTLSEKELESLRYRFDKELKIAEISIPPFCVGKAKLGVFLRDFSVLLNEMLVKWDKEVVARLFTEAMQTLFPDDMADFELGFYEIRGYLYCTIQFSEEGHKKAFGCGWNGTSLAQKLSYAFIPPKRTMFQETDPAIEEALEAKRLRRLRRRTTSLREYIEAGEDEHKDENKGK